MPYIPENKRKFWDLQIDLTDDLTHPGTLNYLFTRLMQHFIKCRGKGWDDSGLDSLYGVLQCCLLELDRRMRVKPTRNLPPPRKEDESYTNYNDFMGNALRWELWRLSKPSHGAEGCSLDVNFAGAWRYYRDQVGLYEDKKIKENGDVY